MEDVFLTALTTPQVRKMFREELEDFFSEANQNINIPQIIDGDFLEENLKIHRQTLNNWRKQGRIPFIQIGNVIRYDFNKVIQALEEGKY